MKTLLFGLFLCAVSNLQGQSVNSDFIRKQPTAVVTPAPKVAPVTRNWVTEQQAAHERAWKLAETLAEQRRERDMLDALERIAFALEQRNRSGR